MYMAGKTRRKREINTLIKIHIEKLGNMKCEVLRMPDARSGKLRTIVIYQYCN